MDLIENIEITSNSIDSIAVDQIIINGNRLTESCIVSNHSIITDLNIDSIEDLTSHHIENLLLSNPELILIGSGTEHLFPDTNLLTPVAKNNIGFEVMNNHSASMTYNVLIAEERQVACLIII